MLPINQLRIDTGSLGGQMILADIRPWHEYTSGKKGKSLGYVYHVAFPKFGMEKLGIKIEGKQRLELSDEIQFVAFDNLEVKLYIIEGKPQLSATATNIRWLNEPKGAS